jgi:hypothetical protein
MPDERVKTAAQALGFRCFDVNVDKVTELYTFSSTYSQCVDALRTGVSGQKVKFYMQCSVEARVQAVPYSSNETHSTGNDLCRASPLSLISQWFLTLCKAEYRRPYSWKGLVVRVDYSAFS